MPKSAVIIRGFGLLATFALIAALIAGLGATEVRAAAVRTATATAKGVAKIRFVQASPDAKAIDLYLDGKIAIKSLAFGKTTDFGAVAAGAHDVAVVAAGGSVSKALATRKITVVDTRAYDVVVHGPAAKLQVEDFKVDLGAVTKGKARVRVIDESADAGALDIAVKGGKALFANVTSTSASVTADVDPGAVNFDVRTAGKTTVVLAIPSVKIEAGKVYEIVLAGDVTGKTLTAITLVAPAAA